MAGPAAARHRAAAAQPPKHHRAVRNNGPLAPFSPNFFTHVSRNGPALPLPGCRRVREEPPLYGGHQGGPRPVHQGLQQVRAARARRATFLPAAAPLRQVSHPAGDALDCCCRSRDQPALHGSSRLDRLHPMSPVGLLPSARCPSAGVPTFTSSRAPRGDGCPGQRQPCNPQTTGSCVRPLMPVESTALHSLGQRSQLRSTPLWAQAL